ncbi:MAG: ATP-dependent DNA helicase [Actinomycetota bacterium]
MTGSVAGREAIEALRRVVSAMPSAEERQGQIDMVHAVAEAIAAERSIIVQAGTGTGKSLGYLVPAILSGRRTVVATATKSLQDQLSRNDLPLLRDNLGTDFTWAVVKGRSNYACLQRIAELAKGSAQPEFDEVAGRARAQLRTELDAIAAWASESTTGDLEEFPRNLSQRARTAVTVSSDECPGRTKCPAGDRCFAEKARAAADAADVIVVNLHLYGFDIASQGAILPAHDLVVFDEVHQLEAVMSDTVGVDLSNGRVGSLAGAVRRVVADRGATDSLENAGLRFSETISPLHGDRVPIPLPTPVADALSVLRIETAAIIQVLREIETDNEATDQRRLRAVTQATRLAEGIDIALGEVRGQVAYVVGSDERPVLRISPLHVGGVLSSGVWVNRPAVLTSATVPVTLPERVGLPTDGTEVLDVPSPFDYERNTRLYCSPGFPDRNSPAFTPFVHDELEMLIGAAGGRTLALFTSTKAMREAAEAMRQRLRFTILTPDDHPRQRLIEMFIEDESSCIFASQGFFQGIDLPGRTLSLVVLDKLPFPRPDDPLLEARRDDVGRDQAFQRIDLPIAATALAQAAGRLVRTAQDRGVVAVLDRRLATMGYWRTLIAAMPPMPRTRNRDEIVEFLARITR